MPSVLTLGGIDSQFSRIACYDVQTLTITFLVSYPLPNFRFGINLVTNISDTAVSKIIRDNGNSGTTKVLVAL